MKPTKLSKERKIYNELIQGYMDGIDVDGKETFQHDRESAETQAAIDMLTHPAVVLALEA